MSSEYLNYELSKFKYFKYKSKYLTLKKSMNMRGGIYPFSKDPNFIDIKYKSPNKVTNELNIHDNSNLYKAILENIKLPPELVTVILHDNQKEEIVINEKFILKPQDYHNKFSISNYFIEVRYIQIKTKIQVDALIKLIKDSNSMYNFIINATYIDENNDEILENFALSVKCPTMGISSVVLPECFAYIELKGSLNLSNCNLASLPTTFSNIILDGDLNLSSNQLTILPIDFHKINTVRDLNLSSNQLTILPELMKTVRDLNLSSNQLTNLPDNFRLLVKLRDLNLSSNQLVKLPIDFHKINTVRDLNLSSNQLTILPELMKTVRDLNLSSNQLGILPDNFGLLVKFRNLNLSNNINMKLPITFKDISVSGNLDISNIRLNINTKNMKNVSGEVFTKIYEEPLLVTITNSIPSLTTMAKSIPSLTTVTKSILPLSMLSNKSS